MSQTAERKDTIQQSTSQIVEDAKAEYNRAKDRLTKAFNTTPDDKINWSPAPTARTPLNQVAHAAMAVAGIQKMFNGAPMPFENINEMDAQWRKEEKQYTTRDQVMDLLNQNSDAYIAWMDSLTPDQVQSTLKAPFGEFPMASAITWPADHLRNHAGQIEYIQTCYGDMDWHMG